MRFVDLAKELEHERRPEKKLTEEHALESLLKLYNAKKKNALTRVNISDLATACVYIYIYILFTLYPYSKNLLEI